MLSTRAPGGGWGWGRGKGAGGQGRHFFTDVVTRFCPAHCLGLCWFPMRGPLFTLFWIACSVASAGTTVYKWVDENGVTHFSDQPHENAAKVEVRDPATYSAKDGPPTSVTEPQTPGEKAPAGSYDRCSVSQPTQGQVFLNTYSVTVAVDVVPVLRPGDRVVLTLDGRPLTDQAGAQTSFTIDPIDRGTHTVEATIQSPTGQPLCTSASATFHVRQTSVLSPAHPPKH
jgi:hypothetical protein